MKVIGLLLSPRYQLLPEAMLRTIVGTEGTTKVLLPEYQVYWPSLLKIQYTELKLSCGNNSFVKNNIYSNGDLDL
jgi:hypothetical protein